MVSKVFPISRWLVVDDTPEDADDIVLAIEGLGGKADTADSARRRVPRRHPAASHRG